VVCADLGRPAGPACHPPPKSKKRLPKKRGASQPLPEKTKSAEVGTFRSLSVARGETPASPRPEDAGMSITDTNIHATLMEVEGSNPPSPPLAIEGPPEEAMDTA